MKSRIRKSSRKFYAKRSESSVRAVKQVRTLRQPKSPAPAAIITTSKSFESCSKSVSVTHFLSYVTVPASDALPRGGVSFIPAAHIALQSPCYLFENTIRGQRLHASDDRHIG